MKVNQQMVGMGRHLRSPADRCLSPFRYPGGKGFFSPFLTMELQNRFGNSMPIFAEPYCGGAGAALNLLRDKKVEKVLLNDADHRIYSAWRAMVRETDRFLERLDSIRVNLSSWNSCLAKLHEKPRKKYDFETGFCTFFVNRTSRSGVLIGSGPIGGYAQDGEWKIGARFNKSTLARRIETLGRKKRQISLSCADGLEFCRNLRKKHSMKNVFLFIDPPYIGAGDRLYHDGMNAEKHRELAQWLKSGAAPHWLVTYDDHAEVLKNFHGLKKFKLPVRYSLSRRRIESELLFKSNSATA